MYNRISTDFLKEIISKESVTAMIINWLGFLTSIYPLRLNFLKTKLFKFGRALDGCYECGCEALFPQLRWTVCKKTMFSLKGEYAEYVDEYIIAITHDVYTKDHQTYLKQTFLELICTHDGGVSIISKSWDGNSYDTRIFRERARLLTKNLKKRRAGPSYLINDSILYIRHTIRCLAEFHFITRITRTIKQEITFIENALQTPYLIGRKMKIKPHFRDNILSDAKREKSISSSLSMGIPL